MVHAAFPLVKLGALLLKQVSKPIASYIVSNAKQHPTFKKYVCMPPAQIYNWCEVKVKMWIMNLGRPVSVPSLNETMAIELGANLLGEGIIFVIAAGILFLEYSRQVRKETAKEEARKNEIDTLSSTIQDLYFQSERQDTQIRELLRIIAELTPPSKRGSIILPPPRSLPPEPLSGLTSTSPKSVNVTSNTQNIVDSRFQGGLILTALSYVTNDVF